MRVVLADDERLSLIHLKSLLEKEIGGVEVVGMYSDPTEIIDMIGPLQPDAIFLDINMPEISGFEIAEQLQVLFPSIEIVFVTAYDDYAVNAFELSVIDYILKPVQLARLEKTIKRLHERVNQKEKRMKTTDTLIGCFNHIYLQLPNNEPQALKWRTSKAQELFAYLLHHRNRTIDRTTLIELLWGHLDHAARTAQLYTTIYQIRHTLKQSGITEVIISSGSLEAGYKLSIGSNLLDIEEWEIQLKQLPPLTVQTIPEHVLVLDLYKGDYLSDYGYLWAESERERLRCLWLHHAETLEAFYTESGLRHDAIHLNQLIHKIMPTHDSSYFNLMKHYDALGNRPAVEEQYWLLKRMLENEFGLSTVNPTVTDWYNRWKNPTQNEF